MMNKKLFCKLYLVSLPLLLLADMVWLGLIASDFYAQALGALFGPVRLWAAVLFYLIFVSGLTYFATYPAVVVRNGRLAVVNGGLFGFFTYLTYDLTNLATVANWPAIIVVPDILWGTVLCAGTAFLTYRIISKKLG